MNRLILLLVLAASSLAGCGLQGVIKKDEVLSADQKQYLAEIAKQPLQFNVPKADGNDSWGRAQSFIAQHSGMKIQTASDYAIQTYNAQLDTAGAIPPSLGSVTYGYNISRSPIGDKYAFDVNCTGPFHGMYQAEINKAAARNAHALAYFIATSKLPYPELIIR